MEVRFNDRGIVPVHFPLNVYKSNLNCKGFDDVFY